MHTVSSLHAVWVLAHASVCTCVCHSRWDRENQQCFPMHNKTVYLKRTHSVLCLAREAMRQAHSHLTGTFGSCQSKPLHFLHKLQSRYTHNYLYEKMIVLAHQEGRRYLHVPQSSGAGFFPPHLFGPQSLAACFQRQVRLPLTRGESDS